MTEDLSWLAGRVGESRATAPGMRDEQLTTLLHGQSTGVVVEPTHVPVAAKTGVPVIALIGWPTGRHHTLVKAAEARLAVHEGASEVWVAVDAEQLSTPEGRNSVLGDVIGVRQVVDKRMGVACSAHDAETVAEIARTAGADLLAVELDGAVPNIDTLDVAAFGAVDFEGVLDALLAGATRVFA